MVLRGRICMLAFLMAFGPEFASSSPGERRRRLPKRVRMWIKQSLGRCRMGQ